LAFLQYRSAIIIGRGWMNVPWRAFAASCAIIPLSGCALYPVPEDVTGVDTYHIVRQIRCETREAARDFILSELEREATDYPGQPANPIAHRLVQEFEADREQMDNFNPNIFSGPDGLQLRNFYNVIYSVGIAYNFDLTMNEENDVGTMIDVLGAWAPKFTLGFSANANRGRSNERSFTVTDTFGGLMTQLGHPRRGVRYCDGQIVQANYVYPIAGHIGVSKLVKTFFELTLFTGLSDSKATPGTAGTPPSIADKLTFTTTIDASLSPKVIFSPAGTTLEMSDVSVTGFARRVDTHQVTVGLAMESKAVADLTSLRSYLFSTRSGPSGTVLGGTGNRGSVGGNVILANTLTARANTSAEGLAALAIDQLKSREIQLVRNR
jgi:hypothetical protein